MELTNQLDIDSFQGLNTSKLRNKSICILGGTGFIGSWLVASLHNLDKTYDLKLNITVYTRDKARASSKFAGNKYNRLTIKEHDFLNGALNLGAFDYFINGATPTSSKPGPNTENIFLHPTLNAIESIIITAKNEQNIPKVLNLSSGAVYGSQPLEVSHRDEEQVDLLENADDYQRAKFLSEVKLTNPDVLEILSPISPRLFAFYGPGMPLNQHFAIGNFMRDGLSGRPIRILGNPNTRRSYMYPTDLVAWLLKSMVDPKPGCFNVGSEESISMAELAKLISDMTSQKGVEFPDPEIPPNNYVPSTKLFREEYAVKEFMPLATGLHHWKSWLASN
jgi:nucleoside-diphosphate-sugar epimerase